MTVRELQTSDVKTVSPDTDLAAVAQLMWDGDCGAVPVVSDDRTVVGMITDRDICIAAATRAKPPADIRASEVIGGNGGVHSVNPDDDVRVAMRTMRKHRVRRVPVVDHEQRLAGILSINDLAINASRQSDGVPVQELLETFQAICSHDTRATA